MVPVTRRDRMANTPPDLLSQRGFPLGAPASKEQPLPFPRALGPGGNAGATLSQLEVLLHPGWTLYEREIDLCGFKSLGCRLRFVSRTTLSVPIDNAGLPCPQLRLPGMSI